MAKTETNKPVVLRALRRLVAECGSQRAAAQRLGVAVSLLNRTLTGADEPTPRLLAALGFQRITYYQRTAK